MGILARSGGCDFTRPATPRSQRCPQPVLRPRNVPAEFLRGHPDHEQEQIPPGGSAFHPNSMANRLTIPITQPVRRPDGTTALLLIFGTPAHAALISPADFELVTQTTGQQAWGFQWGCVVVGDTDEPFGRRAVYKIILGTEDAPHMRPAYRDRNPFNLLRSNLGMRGRDTPGTFWLELRPGEVDPIHFDGGFPNRTPAAIYKHRRTVRPPRDPAAAGLPLERQHWTQRHA